MNSTRPKTPTITIPDKPQFILTVDTEEEWDWDGEFPRPPFSTENVKQIPEFQMLCDDLGIIPTYFIDYAVADMSEHASVLKRYFEANECDIGAHLHPWVNPPVVEEICESNSHSVNLPIALFEQKIGLLTEKIQSVFGEHPYSFRSGRWGINAQQLEVLHRQGYRVDSSIRPFYQHQYFSYKSAPNRPYWPSDSNFLMAGANNIGILEVPTTCGYNFSNFELLDKIHSKLCNPPINRLRLIGILSRAHLLREITITPEGYSAADICRCIDASIKRGDRIINMFFHSSNLLPGCTQYVQSETEKTRFLNVIARSVQHLRDRHHAQFTTMRKIRRQLTGNS